MCGGVCGTGSGAAADRAFSCSAAHSTEPGAPTVFTALLELLRFGLAGGAIDFQVTQSRPGAVDRQGVLCARYRFAERSPNSPRQSLARVAADDLTDPRHQHVHCRDDAAVVVHSQVKGIDGLRVVHYDASSRIPRSERSCSDCRSTPQWKREREFSRLTDRALRSPRHNAYA